MCGIAGAVWTAEAQPVSPATLAAMTNSLAHRGPDAEGVYWSPAISDSDRGPRAALGHRRLSIIDVACGQQPLSNEDGTVWIVFNGEIYNYRELQTELTARGHRLLTSSDTECIVHLYEELGPACVDRLRGMFAFAIWDERRRRLLLARDRLGKKPLVYRCESDRLFFGSELKAILQVPGLPREIDPQALDEYLTYQYVPHPHSILKGFAKLPPAHIAIWENGRLTVKRYWHPPYEDPPATGKNKAATRTPEEWRTALRETLTEAVRLRLRSDVPLGAFLSGGIDSSIIAGLMQKLSDRPIKTFSIGFPVKAFDERSYAREAANRIGSEHHEAVVEPHALEMLPKLIWHYDEPFADSSAIPTMYLSRMTREHVTVALSGDGGDELFAGYQRYGAVQLAAYVDRLPNWVRRGLSAPLWQKLPASVEQKSRRRQFKRLLSALGEEPELRYLQWVSIFDAARRRSLYSPEFAESLATTDSADFLRAAYRECACRDFTTRTTCVDVLTYLPCDILTKVDIASMAYGLECRSPFLDQEVVELAAQMPMALKRRRFRGKRILLETFGHLLPDSIQKRSKMGFGVPLDHWFRGELRPMLEGVLLDPATLRRGIFQPDAIRKLVSEHVEGRWDHSYRLWALLCLELWQQTFVDPKEAPSSAPSVSITSRAEHSQHAPTP
jgi:asparagine synthase (glutamine-hydrolysing)